MAVIDVSTIELLSSPPPVVAGPGLLVERLDSRVSLLRDDVERLVEHQVVLDDIQTRRLSDLRRALACVSGRLREQEQAADVLEARLADAQALALAQAAELASLTRRVAALEAR